MAEYMRKYNNESMQRHYDRLRSGMCLIRVCVDHTLDRDRFMKMCHLEVPNYIYDNLKNHFSEFEGKIDDRDFILVLDVHKDKKVMMATNNNSKTPIEEIPEWLLSYACERPCYRFIQDRSYEV